MEIHRFLYKGDKHPFLKFLPFLLLLIAVGAVFNDIVSAVILLVIAALIWMYQTGIEVDFKAGTYRFTTTMGPVVLGNWTKLPPLKSISVFATNKVTTMTSRSNNTSIQTDRVVQVNLITEKNHKIKILEADTAETAFFLAKAAARLLDLQVYDATEREGKWIDL